MKSAFAGPRFPTLTLLGDPAPYFDDVRIYQSEEQLFEFLHKNFDGYFNAIKYVSTVSWCYGAKRVKTEWNECLLDN
jgi:hypothetical protein